ncbi:MAG: hypothetical protein ACYC9Z_10080 [Casimicrobiaceae bacterium]
MGSLYTHRNRLQACATGHGRRRKKNFPLGVEKAARRWIRDAEATLDLPAISLLDGLRGWYSGAPSGAEER